MKKLSIGMPTLLEFDNLEENIKLCTDLGLDFIELNMNLPQYQIEELNTSKLLSLKEKYNIFFTIHLPDEIDITHFNEKIRNAYLDTVRETIEISKVIECPILNMHMNLGVYFTMPTHKVFLYEKHYKTYFKRIIEFRGLVEKWIGRDNIEIAIENTGIYNIEYIASAVTKLIKNDRFVLTWDTGHDYSSGNDANFIKGNLIKLNHMHIHDAVGKNNHLPLYSGEIDLETKLKLAIDNSLTCVIETKTKEGLVKSVYELKERGYL